MALGHQTNDYQKLLAGDFDKTPKSVYAAIALSFAMRLTPEDDEKYTEALALVRSEWAALHHNAIVPQKPLTGGR